MYAVAGALAVDCVRHGHPAMVHTIVDCMGEFVRKSLISWLKRRGGWVRGHLCFRFYPNLIDCVGDTKLNSCEKECCRSGILVQLKSIQIKFVDIASVAPFKQKGLGPSC